MSGQPILIITLCRASTSCCEFQRNLQSSKNEEHGSSGKRLNHTLRPHSHLLHDGARGRPRVVGTSSSSKRPNLPGALPQRFDVSSRGAQLTCKSLLGGRTHIRLENSLRRESVHVRGLRDKPESGRATGFRGRRTGRGDGGDEVTPRFRAKENGDRRMAPPAGNSR